MPRIFKKELQGQPVNFNRDNPKPNLRSSPGIRPNNLVASPPKWFISLGKLGTSTGTIETVPGKKYFWLEMEPSTEVNAWFAVSFNLNAPKRVWVRSDVVHWKAAKTIVRRATEKAVEPVKDLVDVTTDAAGDVFTTVIKNLGKPILILGLGYLGFKAISNSQKKRRRL